MIYANSIQITLTGANFKTKFVREFKDYIPLSGYQIENIKERFLLSEGINIIQLQSVEIKVDINIIDGS